MTPEQFIFWLHGALSITDPKTLSEAQAQLIKELLRLVIENVARSAIANNESRRAMVRAKFECESITEIVGGKTYVFNAVCGSEENKRWAQATPFGKLQITINNPAAQGFSVGKSYYLDLLESQVC